MEVVGKGHPGSEVKSRWVPGVWDGGQGVLRIRYGGHRVPRVRGEEQVDAQGLGWRAGAT